MGAVGGLAVVVGCLTTWANADLIGGFQPFLTTASVLRKL
jgi:hypothetical protein